MPQLAEAWRQKYPGQYDDLSDDDLEKAVIAKYPEYKDLATPPKATTSDLPGGAKPIEKVEPEPSVESYEDEANKESNPLKTAVAGVKAAGDTQLATNPLRAARSAYDMAGDVWNRANTPLFDFPTRAVDTIADPIRNYGDTHDSPLGTAARYGGAFIHSLGEQASGFTSPLGAAALTIPGAGSAISKVAPEVGAAVSGVGRAINVPFMLQGVKEMGTGEHWDEKLGGLLQAVLGFHGAASGGAHPLEAADRPSIHGEAADIGEPLGPDQTNATPLSPDVLAGLRETLKRVQEQGPDFKTSNEPVNPLENKVGFPEQVLPPDMIPQGGEGAYNAVHSPDNPLTLSPQDTARKLTEDAVDRLRGPRDLSRQNPLQTGPDVRDLAPKGRGVPQDNSDLFNLARVELAKMKESYGADSEEYRQANQELADMMRSETAKSVGRGTGIRPELGPVAGDENPLSPIKQEPNPFPEFARTKEGNFQLGADVSSLGDILGNSLYPGKVGSVATKELLQNALDAVRPLGDKGQVHVQLHDYGTEPYIHITDNGRGMSPDEAATHFIDLGSSGKRGEEDAVGGFGVAKASFLLGSKNFDVTTVADVKGQRIQTKFKGDKTQLLEGKVKPEITVVNRNTPTGTDIKVATTPDNFDRYGSTDLLDNVQKHSDIPGSLKYATQYHEPYKNWLTKKVDEPNWIEKDPNQPADKHVASISTPSSDIDLSIPGTAEPDGERQIHQIIGLNNGMYQHTQGQYMPQSVDMPSHVKVNIHSKVPEGHADYPFTMNRTEMRGTTLEAVKKYIDENIIEPQKAKNKKGIQDLYDGMQDTGPDSLGRSFVFHDTGSRYTPEEIQAIKSSPVLRDLASKLQDSITHGLDIVGSQTWKDRLEKIGLIFDPELHGIHIPNPSNGKSAILINPFSHFVDANPETTASGMFHTGMHELAHVSPMDRGHNESFAGRLGDILTKVGGRNALKHENAIEGAITDSSGQYNPEFQELLQQYKESRGRSEVKEDILTKSGTKSKVTPTGQEGNDVNSGPTGEGATPAVQQLSDTLKNNPDSGPEVAKKFNQLGRLAGTETQKEKLWRNASDVAKLPRAIMTSYDISGPGRQGLPLALNKEYWTSMDDMIKSWGSQRALDAVKQSIMDHPNFQPGPDGTTVAQRAGLNLFGNEEHFQSKMAEAIPGVGRSERAYNGFLWKLRADTFNRLISDYQAVGQDPTRDDVLLRGIGKFINDATGRGTMGKNFEDALPIMSQTFFAPRLVASRINMYKTLLNPLTYASEDPIMRKQALKSLLAITGIGQTMGSLAKYGGATVSTDPNNPDFGKIKVGNTRIDPFAGFQQYATAASRIVSGRSVSSYTGKTTDLDSGRYGRKTRADIAEQFVLSKLAPIPSFVWGMMTGKNWDGTSFDAKKAIAERMFPLAMQDLKDIWSQDPKSFPAGTFAGAFPNVTKAALSVAPIVGFGSQTYGR